MQRKLRNRRRSRGAVAVEGVVVVTFFVLMFAMMVFVSSYYAEKQRTLRVAKEYAWTYAMANCDLNEANAVVESSGTPAMGDTSGAPDGGVGTEPVEEFKGSDPGMQVFDKDWGTASATVQGSVTAAPMLGGFEKNLSTTTKVQCNEKPEKGNMLGVLKYAWSSRTAW